MPLSRFVAYFCALTTVCVVGATRLAPPASSLPAQERSIGCWEDGTGAITCPISSPIRAAHRLTPPPPLPAAVRATPRDES